MSRQSFYFEPDGTTYLYDWEPLPDDYALIHIYNAEGEHLETSAPLDAWTGGSDPDAVIHACVKDNIYHVRYCHKCSLSKTSPLGPYIPWT